MENALTIAVEPASDAELRSVVSSLLEDANTEFAYPLDSKRFLAVLRGPDGHVEGGINAHARWGWIHIEALVVKAPWQGQGYGGRLLAAAEEWGRGCSCHDAWLMTLSVNARRFYERAGYSVFAELPNFPERQTRFFLRKRLL